MVLFLQNKEEKQTVKDQMEGVLEKLWRDMQVVLHEYNVSTKDKIIAADSLHVKDKQSAKEIDAHKKHIQKLQVRQKSSVVSVFF